MKNINPLGLFDDHFIMEKLTKLGDPLQKLNEFIHWKIFESPINEAFRNEDRGLSKGGRPPFNRLMLFKALIIQTSIFLRKADFSPATGVKQEFTSPVPSCWQQPTSTMGIATWDSIWLNVRSVHWSSRTEGRGTPYRSSGAITPDTSGVQTTTRTYRIVFAFIPD